jgi:histone-lysine N-methyltransferase SETMAR
MSREKTVNIATYADLRPAIKSKGRRLLSTGVLSQHDNAQPHTAHSIVATIQDLSFRCLPHPPYLPDLTPSDFHVFGLLKEAMGGKSSRSDESRWCMSGYALSQKIFYINIYINITADVIMIQFVLLM